MRQGSTSTDACYSLASLVVGAHWGVVGEADWEEIGRRETECDVVSRTPQCCGVPGGSDEEDVGERKRV